MKEKQDECAAMPDLYNLNAFKTRNQHFDAWTRDEGSNDYGDELRKLKSENGRLQEKMGKLLEELSLKNSLLFRNYGKPANAGPEDEVVFNIESLQEKKKIIFLQLEIKTEEDKLRRVHQKQHEVQKCFFRSLVEGDHRYGLYKKFVQLEKQAHLIKRDIEEMVSTLIDAESESCDSESESGESDCNESDCEEPEEHTGDYLHVNLEESDCIFTEIDNDEIINPADEQSSDENDCNESDCEEPEEYTATGDYLHVNLEESDWIFTELESDRGINPADEQSCEEDCKQGADTKDPKKEMENVVAERTPETTGDKSVDMPVHTYQPEDDSVVLAVLWLFLTVAEQVGIVLEEFQTQKPGYGIKISSDDQTDVAGMYAEIIRTASASS